MIERVQKITEELIEIGLEMECYAFNERFPRTEGFTNGKRNLRAKGVRRIRKLEGLGINIEDLAAEDAELEYAIQFI